MKLSKVAEHLDGARVDLLSGSRFPEIRRRTHVIGIFPDHTALVRRIGSVLAKQHDE